MRNPKVANLHRFTSLKTAQLGFEHAYYMKNITRSVLIVDDEFVSNLILSKFLEDYNNVEHKSFSNGSEIKEYLMNNPNDEAEFLFLDLRMPIMNGFDFLDWYETCDRQIKAKIYVLSSTLDSRDEKKVSNYKCVAGFIEKPITGKRLNEIIF